MPRATVHFPPTPAPTVHLEMTLEEAEIVSSLLGWTTDEAYSLYSTLHDAVDEAGGDPIRYTPYVNNKPVTVSLKEYNA